MDVTRSAFGAWNGGRFMHYGLALNDDHWIRLVHQAWERGIRTFVTADVYGNGQADELLGRALAGLPRDSYCLVGSVGHDFYTGKREGAKGYPRFTDPRLRSSGEFGSYLRMAVENSLKRCQTDHFDLLLLHNPDSIGYSSDSVWTSLEKLREVKLASMLGIAPGPANGFTLDILMAFERFGSSIDWAMLILNPFEPWPGSLVLPAAKAHEVKVLTRVVDYGGLFHDDVRPGHTYGPSDHRTFRASGWIDEGFEKLEQIRPIAKHHGITLLQLACLWNLAQPAVASVVPTLIQEISPGAKSIESKVDELAALGPGVPFNSDELEVIARIGNNRGCMQLKGAHRTHTTASEPDRWSIQNDHEMVARKWNIDPDLDLAHVHRSAD